MDFIEKLADELARRRRADRWGKTGATVGAVKHAIPLALGLSQGHIILNPGGLARDMATGYGVGRAAHRVLRGSVKEASLASHAAELGGLAILAKPSWDEYRGRHVDTKTKAKTEMAGLGLLAAPSAISLAHAAIKKARGLPKVAGILTGGPKNPKNLGLGANPSAYSGRASVLMQNKLPAPAAAMQKSVAQVSAPITPSKTKLVPDSRGAYDMLAKIKAMKAGYGT